MLKGTTAKTLGLLSSLAKEPRHWTLKELSQQTGIDKSTAYRLLRTMRDLGFVEKDMGTKTYSTGPRLRSLLYSAQDQWIHAARPALRSLSESLGVTVAIRLREGNQMVVIDRVESQGHLRVTYPIGDRHPITFGGSGKLFLAYLSKNEVVELIKSVDSEKGEGGLAMSRFWTELRRIKNRGHAITRGVVTRGIVTVSIPILGKHGEILGVLSLSWPSVQYPPGSITKIIAIGKARASEISSKLSGSLVPFPKESESKAATPYRLVKGV